MADTIWNNNYILKGTVATSAGIVGDGSTQNPLRADETVLFSSESGVQNNITLSENIENFEFVRVEWCPYTEASNWTAPYDVVLSKVKSGLLHLCGWGIANDALAQVMTNLILSCSNKSVTVYKSGTITSLNNGTATSSLTGYKIFKIVGINRIANN